jgi:hypothetical protein
MGPSANFWVKVVGRKSQTAKIKCKIANGNRLDFSDTPILPPGIMGSLGPGVSQVALGVAGSLGGLSVSVSRFVDGFGVPSGFMGREWPRWVRGDPQGYGWSREVASRGRMSSGGYK